MALIAMPKAAALRDAGRVRARHPARRMAGNRDAAVSDAACDCDSEDAADTRCATTNGKALMRCIHCAGRYDIGSEHDRSSSSRDPTLRITRVRLRTSRGCDCWASAYPSPPKPQRYSKEDQCGRAKKQSYEREDIWFFAPVRVLNVLVKEVWKAPSIEATDQKVCKWAKEDEAANPISLAGTHATFTNGLHLPF